MLTFFRADLVELQHTPKERSEMLRIESKPKLAERARTDYSLCEVYLGVGVSTLALLDYSSINPVGVA